MVSNKITEENSNASVGDDYSETNEEVQINPMVLLVRIKHVDGRPIESEILTETTFHELCQYANSRHEPFTIEILSAFSPAQDNIYVQECDGYGECLHTPEKF